MGRVDAAADAAPDEEKREALAALHEYGKLVEAPELADVVLVGEGGRFLELEVLKAADLFQAEGLLKHCLEGFRGP